MAGWIYIALRLLIGIAAASGGAEAGGAEAAGAEHAAAEGGGHGEHGIPWETLVFATINFTIFLGLLVWFARRPVGDALKARALTVRQGLDEASRLQADARQRFADVESKLIALGRQVEDLKSDAQTAADNEMLVLQQRADADAQRIRDTAERTIREESGRAQGILRAEAAALAVQLAKDILRGQVNNDDQQRLARQLLDTVHRDTGSLEVDHG